MVRADGRPRVAIAAAELSSREQPGALARLKHGDLPIEQEQDRAAVHAQKRARSKVAAHGYSLSSRFCFQHSQVDLQADQGSGGHRDRLGAAAAQRRRQWRGARRSRSQHPAGIPEADLLDQSAAQGGSSAAGPPDWPASLRAAFRSRRCPAAAAPAGRGGWHPGAIDQGRAAAATWRQADPGGLEDAEVGKGRPIRECTAPTRPDTSRHEGTLRALSCG